MRRNVAQTVAATITVGAVFFSNLHPHWSQFRITQLQRRDGHHHVASQAAPVNAFVLTGPAMDFKRCGQLCLDSLRSQKLQVISCLAKNVEKEEAKYNRFLKVAKDQGVDHALLYAADNLPVAFCTKFKHLCKAAKFVAKHKHQSGELPAPEQTTEETEYDTSASKATLKVCVKCIQRMQKKGEPFDPMISLQQAAEDVDVRPVGCMKFCKKGPNVQVTVDDEPLVVDGMLPQEAADRCFHHVANNVAVNRVTSLACMDSAKQQSDGQLTVSVSPGGATDGSMSAATSPSADRNARAKPTSELR